MGLTPKRQSGCKTTSDSNLIVPASASSAADRAPRSRYLRAGTAIFRLTLSQLQGNHARTFSGFLGLYSSAFYQFTTLSRRIRKDGLLVQSSQFAIFHHNLSINYDAPYVGCLSGIHERRYQISFMRG